MSTVIQKYDKNNFIFDIYYHFIDINLNSLIRDKK